MKTIQTHINQIRILIGKNKYFIYVGCGEFYRGIMIYQIDVDMCVRLPKKSGSEQLN